MAVPQIYPAPDNAQFNTPYPAPATSDGASQGTTTNTTSKVTLPADTQRGNILGMVLWSLNGSTTPSANLTVTGQTAGKVLDLDITAQGANSLTFTPPYIFGTSEAVTISLGPGGAGVTGKVNVVAWKLT